MFAEIVKHKLRFQSLLPLLRVEIARDSLSSNATGRKQYPVVQRCATSTQLSHVCVLFHHQTTSVTISSAHTFTPPLPELLNTSPMNADSKCLSIPLDILPDFLTLDDASQLKLRTSVYETTFDILGRSMMHSVRHGKVLLSEEDIQLGVLHHLRQFKAIGRLRSVLEPVEAEEEDQGSNWVPSDDEQDVTSGLIATEPALDESSTGVAAVNAELPEEQSADATDAGLAEAQTNEVSAAQADSPGAEAAWVDVVEPDATSAEDVVAALQDGSGDNAETEESELPQTHEHLALHAEGGDQSELLPTPQTDVQGEDEGSSGDDSGDDSGDEDSDNNSVDQPHQPLEPAEAQLDTEDAYLSDSSPPVVEMEIEYESSSTYSSDSDEGTDSDGDESGHDDVATEVEGHDADEGEGMGDDEDQGMGEDADPEEQGAGASPVALASICTAPVEDTAPIEPPESAVSAALAPGSEATENADVVPLPPVSIDVEQETATTTQPDPPMDAADATGEDLSTSVDVQGIVAVTAPEIGVEDEQEEASLPGWLETEELILLDTPVEWASLLSCPVITALLWDEVVSQETWHTWFFRDLIEEVKYQITGVAVPKTTASTAEAPTVAAIRQQKVRALCCC
jgi:hypothetical protein